MINVGFDKAKKLGIISGDLFQEMREHFSIKNDAARLSLVCIMIYVNLF